MEAVTLAAQRGDRQQTLGQKEKIKSVGRLTSASLGLKNVVQCFRVKFDILCKRNKLVRLQQLNVIMEFFSNDVAIPGK